MSSGQEIGYIFREGSGPTTTLLRSPMVLIISIGLWGMNIYFFRIFGIDYIRVFNHDLEMEHRNKRKKDDTSLSNNAFNLSFDNGDDKKSNETLSSFSVQPKFTCNTTIDNTIPEFEDTTKRRSIELEMTTVIGNNKIVLDNPLSSSSVSSEIRSRHSDRDMNDYDDVDIKTLILEPFLKSDEYPSLLESKSKSYLDTTETKLLYLSLVLMILLHITSTLWIEIWKGNTIGAIFFFNASVAIGILIPIPFTFWVRAGIFAVIRRSLSVFKPRCSYFKPQLLSPIPFIDTFFVDSMCSLSKVFFDWGLLWHLAINYPNPVPASTLSILIPSFLASLPYIIRTRQCVVMFTVGRLRKDPKSHIHVLNATKYSTSLITLIISAYEKTIVNTDLSKTLEKVLVLFLAINATYSLIWDITMDWGMMQHPNALIKIIVEKCTASRIKSSLVGPVDVTNSIPKNCIDLILRPKLRFGTPISILVIFFDILLRYSWMLRFVKDRLFLNNNDGYILCIQFLEIFRRAIWNLLRVEWENIKQTKTNNLPQRRRQGILEGKEKLFCDKMIKSGVSPRIIQNTNMKKSVTPLGSRLHDNINSMKQC